MATSFRVFSITTAIPMCRSLGEERKRTFALVSGISSPAVTRMTCRDPWSASPAQNCATVLNPGDPHGKEFLLPEM